MAEIYVPIDYSNLKEILPVGDDIIYSTLCKAYHTDAGSLIIWKTHLLMTEKGIAFSKPGEKKKDPPELIYIDWTKVVYVLKKGLRVNISLGYPASKFDYEMVDLNLKSDPNFESKDKFKKRLNEFPRKFIPYVLEKKKAFLSSPDSSFLNIKQRKLQEHALTKLEKFFNKKFK